MFHLKLSSEAVVTPIETVTASVVAVKPTLYSVFRVNQ